jgi:hypothetical protein
MPCESSSQISNSTNGIEPPRGFVSVKQSKDGILKQIVPEYDKLKNQYELLWDIKDNEGYLQLCVFIVYRHRQHRHYHLPVPIYPHHHRRVLCDSKAF